jgi:hypothetical protein
MCGLESMQRRGRMQVGMVADIAIFDPATVTEMSTFQQGCVPSKGIPHVMVNGQFVVKDSHFLKNVKPGQPIRFPGKQTVGPDPSTSRNGSTITWYHQSSLEAPNRLARKDSHAVEHCKMELF